MASINLILAARVLAFLRGRDYALPQDVRDDMLVYELSSSDWPIMQVVLSGPFDLGELRKVGEDLQDLVEQVPGVLSVDLTGGVEREVRVDVDVIGFQIGHGLIVIRIGKIGGLVLAFLLFPVARNHGEVVQLIVRQLFERVVEVQFRRDQVIPGHLAGVFGAGECARQHQQSGH